MEQLDRIGLDLGDQDSFDAPFRARSNTWPLHPKSHDLFGEPSNEELDACGGAITPTNDQTSANNLLTTISDSGLVCDSDIPTTAHEASSLDQLGNGATTNGCLATGPKKNTSRRNAWGNMSYADLITQAIQSSPDKRLTLSQIYDWMVQNVPYFKDKGDSNSSAGWKVSVARLLQYAMFFRAASRSIIRTGAPEMLQLRRPWRCNAMPCSAIEFRSLTWLSCPRHTAACHASQSMQPQRKRHQGRLTVKHLEGEPFHAARKLHILALE